MQATQLKVFIPQADGWGEEITAQIPAAEIEPESDSHNIGGVRKTSDHGAVAEVLLLGSDRGAEAGRREDADAGRGRFSSLVGEPGVGAECR